MRRFLVFLLILSLLIAGGYYLYMHTRPPENKDFLVLFGNVDVRQVDLGFRVGGRVEKMLYEEGDLVPKGMLMGFLEKQPYLDQVLEAQANVTSVKANLLNAEKILKRRLELVKDGGVSDEDYQNAIASKEVYQANYKEAQAALGVAKKNLQDTEVHSPIDGTILTRIREPGTVVNPADPIYTLSILSPVWVRAFVAEPALGLIYPGMTAEIFTDTKLGGKIYQGHIGFISPVAEFTPKTVETTQLRTDLVYRLRVIADNPDRGLRQGMPVTIKLPLKREDHRKEP